jgi:hypothetical protein
MNRPRSVIISGRNFTYRRYDQNPDNRNRHGYRWEFVAGPGPKWKGALTLAELARLPSMALGSSAIGDRLNKCEVSIFAKRQNTTNEWKPSGKDIQLRTKFAKLPAPQYRPKPSFGVWT